MQTEMQIRCKKYINLQRELQKNKLVDRNINKNRDIQSYTHK